MDSISSAIERITPNVAKQMLERVFSNAKVDVPSREAFGRDMAAGGWVLKGSPIVFSVNGVLLDGRARLHACIDSGTAFDTLVIRGIDNGAFETIDAVRKRTLADILSIRQERHGRPLGAALRILWSYGLGATPGIGKTPSPTALLALLERKPQIRDSIMPALRATPLLPHGCAIALHHLASAINPVKATHFLTQLQEPTAQAPDHPIVQLRNVLMQMRSQGGSRKQTYMLAVAIKAWNAFEAGKTIKALRYGAGEKFPRIQVANDWGPLSRMARDASDVLRQEDGKTVVDTPDEHPQGMGVTGLLKSELFGLSSTLDIETERRLFRRNELFATDNRTPTEDEEFSRLSAELADLGFSNADFKDPQYAMFARKMAKHTKFHKPVLTAEEQAEQDRIADEIIEEILREEGRA